MCSSLLFFFLLGKLDNTIATSSAGLSLALALCQSQACAFVVEKTNAWRRDKMQPRIVFFRIHGK